jgi:AcrR family transcriptional regulator
MAAAAKKSPTYGIQDAPERGPRARTYRLLLGCAMTLVKDGRVPSVAEVAMRTGVSRATAYRYFPSRSKLISAVISEGLAPVRNTETAAADGPRRLRELFEKTFPLFKENERHMRAALQLALEHEGLERAGLLEEEIFRRGHRCGILRRAATPMRADLGAAGFERLLKALSLIYGIEIYVVMKDIWGAPDREIEALARWMLDAIVSAALRDARTSAAPEKRRAAHRRPSPRSRVSA